MDLTDQQWTIIEPLFEEKRRLDGPGAPTLQAARGRRTVLCLAAQLAAARHALGAVRRELRRHAAARMHPAQPFMR